MRDLPIRADAALIGELGLAGELRLPGQMQTRLREVAKLGFKAAIVPKRLRKAEKWPDDIEIIEARSVNQALDAAFAIVGESSTKRKKLA
jgi:DNA repair protein RadA/Sms